MGVSIGSIYNRYKTKDIGFFGGLINIMPKFAVFFLIFSLGSIGFPGSSGFIGEFLTLLAVFSKNTLVACLASLGIILAAAYMLKLYKKVFLGEINNNILSIKDDLKTNEILVFTLLGALIILIGIKPNLLLNFSTTSIERIVTLYPISIF